MQTKAHSLHVSLSHSLSFTLNVILANAWTFIKAAALQILGQLPRAQSFRDPFAHPAFKTTVTRMQKHPHVETHVLQGCCSSIICGFSAPWLMLKEECVCVCVCV